jgi:hypothetical protein
MKRVVAVLMVALLTGGGLVAAVEAAVLNTQLPFAGSYVNPCTGEVVVFTGNVYVLIGQFLDSGGEIRLTYHSNFDGIIGAGVSGPFQIPTDMSKVLLLGAPPVSVSFPNDFRVVGTNGSFSGQLPLTVSISATGGLGATVGAVSLVCQ